MKLQVYKLGNPSDFISLNKVSKKIVFESHKIPKRYRSNKRRNGPLEYSFLEGSFLKSFQIYYIIKYSNNDT